jgi:hypothetical protein
MKLHRKLVLAALPFAFSAGSASAYQLSPPGIVSHLTGRLLLNPPAGAPFECHVHWKLKTQNGRGKPGKIVAATVVSNKACQAAFVLLPWTIEVNDPDDGTILGGSFLNAEGGCTSGSFGFSLNSSGIWAIPAGGCVSGTLTSNPPVTIVP